MPESLQRGSHQLRTPKYLTSSFVIDQFKPQALERFPFLPAMRDKVVDRHLDPLSLLEAIQRVHQELVIKGVCQIEQLPASSEDELTRMVKVVLRVCSFGTLFWSQNLVEGVLR